MAVRPFFVSCEIEGRKTPLSGGCSSKDGSQTTYIFQREDGAITCPLKVQQTSFRDERGILMLKTEAYDTTSVEPMLVFSHTTRY